MDFRICFPFLNVWLMELLRNHSWEFESWIIKFLLVRTTVPISGETGSPLSNYEHNQNLPAVRLCFTMFWSRWTQSRIQNAQMGLKKGTDRPGQDHITKTGTEWGRGSTIEAQRLFYPIYPKFWSRLSIFSIFILMHLVQTWSREGTPLQ